MSERLEKQVWMELLTAAVWAIGGSKDWHWFAFHFNQIAPRPLCFSIVGACADCEKKLPGLGFQFIKDIAAIRGKEKHDPHYDQLLQKLAELLVLRQLLTLDWPEGTVFQHEPVAFAGGKRPELRVVTLDRSFLFEVKTPSLREHNRARKTNPFQAPSRALPIEQIKALVGNAGLTLPRDNPVKDFLVDADEKFAQFKVAKAETSVLVIVWDDFFYEPITVLKHAQCGLLTENSYLKDATGAAVQFANIDAVVVVRHLAYFDKAAGERPLEEREHALDFGGEHSLPNVFIAIGDKELVPDGIRQGLRAVSWDDPKLQSAADYRPQDIVFWL